MKALNIVAYYAKKHLTKVEHYEAVLDDNTHYSHQLVDNTIQAQLEHLSSIMDGWRLTRSSAKITELVRYPEIVAKATPTL